MPYIEHLGMDDPYSQNAIQICRLIGWAFLWSFWDHISSTAIHGSLWDPNFAAVKLGHLGRWFLSRLFFFTTVVKGGPQKPVIALLVRVITPVTHLQGHITRLRAHLVEGAEVWFSTPFDEWRLVQDVFFFQLNFEEKSLELEKNILHTSYQVHLLINPKTKKTHPPICLGVDPMSQICQCH